MKTVIHIFGGSGSGTTTLGRELSARLGLPQFDSDDYYWEPTDPPYQTARSPEERVQLMKKDIEASTDGCIISGSLCGWGDRLTSYFTLAVRLVIWPDLRIERLAKRERMNFGDRLLEGGDMHKNHVEFMEWAKQYDTAGPDMRSMALHDMWSETLRCPILTLDSAEKSPAELADAVIEVLG